MVSGQLASRYLDTSRAQARLQPALENPKPQIYPLRRTFHTSFSDFQPRPRIFPDHADDTTTDERWHCFRAQWLALQILYAHYIHHSQPISSVVKCIFFLQDPPTAEGGSTRRSILTSLPEQKAGYEDLPRYLGSLGASTCALVIGRYKLNLYRSHGEASNAWAITLLE